MCLIPGLASGKHLESAELLDESLAVDLPDGGTCGCGHAHAPNDDRGFSRRDLARRAGAAAAVLAGGGLLGQGLPTAFAAGPPTGASGGEPEPDRVIMLGVNGGPVLSPVHSQPSICLVVNGDKYLVDCGGDAARQMVNAGLNFKRVRHIFLTHQHLDHTAGYPELALLGWCYQTGGALQPGVQLWGPPPITGMQQHFEAMFKLGVEMFEEVGFPPFGNLIKPRALSLPKRGIVKVMEDDNVRVHATRVFHGPEVADAYAYRFDVKATGKSVAFSGDTVPDDQLVALARDVDLLIHEAQLNANIPLIVGQVAPSVRKPLEKHLLNSHTNVLAVPRIAKEAGAGRVSMCHYGLGKPEAFLPLAQAAAAQAGYTGEVLAPVELQQVFL
jgi:ribonuclease BN (tRNA processing enzyme)